MDQEPVDALDHVNVPRTAPLLLFVVVQFVILAGVALGGVLGAYNASVFAAVALSLNAVTGATTYLFIISPLRKMETAMELMNNMEFHDARELCHTLLSRPFMVHEVFSVLSIFSDVCFYLIQYKAFVPEPFAKPYDVETAALSVIGSHSSSSGSVELYKDASLKRLQALQGLVNFRVRLASLLRVDAAPGKATGTEAQSAVNSWVNCLAEATRYYEGLVLTVTGSTLVVVWNGHRPNTRHQVLACLCVKRFAAGSLRARAWSAGIATSILRIGYVGNNTVKAAAVLGDAQNILLKLTQLAAQVNTLVILSSAAHDGIRNTLPDRPVDIVCFTATSSSEPVYELLICEAAHRSDEALASYKVAFTALRRGNYGEAKRMLTEYIEEYPCDKQAKRLLGVAEMLEKDKQSFERRYVGWGAHGADPGGDGRSELDENWILTAESLQIIGSEEDPVGTNPLEPPSSQDHEVASVPPSAAASGMSVLLDSTGSTWYILGKLLGTGAYGQVMLGMSSSGNFVAVKTVTAKVATSQEYLAEITLLQSLRDDHIVAFLGSGIAGAAQNTAFFVMEWGCGGSLKDLLNSLGHAFPIDLVKRCTHDMLKGLRYLHKKNILHRDLKPHNVLLTSDGRCKLADFGAAAKVPKGGSSKSNSIIGTPVYMSPEACKGVVDKASDIWSLGITVCQVYTNELPYNFRCVRVKYFMASLSSGSLQPQIPPVVTDEHALNFFSSCLTKAPDDRPTAETLLKHEFLL